jgi:hypothetical protein
LVFFIVGISIYVWPTSLVPDDHRPGNIGPKKTSMR